MKTLWRLDKSGDAGAVTVWFSGWGRDTADAVGIDGNCLLCWDYTEVGEAGELIRQLLNFPRRRLVAWSLGVYAAAELFQRAGADFFMSATAVNGTLSPISSEFGITPEVFRGTIDNWGVERARERFLQRLAGSRSAMDRLPVVERTPGDQQAELAALAERIARVPTICNLYSAAVVGTADRIFPAESQLRSWRQYPATRIVTCDMPHYPLFAPQFRWGGDGVGGD